MATAAVRTLALISVLAAAWWAAPHRARASSADAGLFRQAAMALGRETPVAVARWLDRHDEVSVARIGPDHRTLTIHFVDGGTAAILAPSLGNVALQPRSGAFRPQAQTGALGRAAALEPFATELGLSPGSFDPVVSDLQRAGFAVDALYDSQVTLSTMAALARYNVVYVLSHSGVEDDGTGVLATAEETACKPYTSPDGTVQAVGVWGSTKCYLAITPTFIEKLPQRFPPNSIVFLNGCTLLTSHPFWVALANQGAGAMLSWSGDAQGQDDFLTAEAFFGEMADGQTVSGAIDALTALGYGRSSYQGKLATLGYRGDGNITLREAAAAVPPPVTPTLIPTDTPVPTNTPTPLPATATSTPTDTPTAAPSPTPTSTPGPDPTLSLPVSAKPGGRVTVVVEHASPGSQAQIVVTYPSGSTVRQTQTAGVDGSLHFTYEQQAAEITRASQTAHVAIQGEGMSGAFTLTGAYRVDFAPVDVYIQQRHPRTGSTVTVWTHSTSKGAVRLRIRSAGRMLRTAQTVGGRWSRLSYRLPARVRSGQSLLVAARVGSGSGLDLAIVRVSVR